MSDVLSENVLTPAAAARELNERLPDARFTPTGIWRWMKRGALAADGQRVFLENVRLGRRRITSREALARFAARLGRPHVSTAEPSTHDENVQRARTALEHSGFFN